MPSVSQSQNAAMHAAAEGRSTLGIPAKVGKDFVAADAGKKVGALPDHVSKLRSRLRQHVDKPKRGP